MLDIASIHVSCGLDLMVFDCICYVFDCICYVFVFAFLLAYLRIGADELCDLFPQSDILHNRVLQHNFELFQQQLTQHLWNVRESM